jgi:hypothetical protein
VAQSLILIILQRIEHLKTSEDELNQLLTEYFRLRHETGVHGLLTHICSDGYCQMCIWRQLVTNLELKCSSILCKLYPVCVFVMAFYYDSSIMRVSFFDDNLDNTNSLAVLHSDLHKRGETFKLVRFC